MKQSGNQQLTTKPQTKQSSSDELSNLLLYRNILECSSTNNTEKIKKLVEIDDENMLETLKKVLSENDVLCIDYQKELPAEPTLALEIINLEDSEQKLELLRSDVEELFGKYGRIVKLETFKTRATIVYSSIISAAIARKALNNYEIKELGVKLLISFSSSQLMDAMSFDMNPSQQDSQRKGSYFSMNNAQTQPFQPSVSYLNNNQKIIRIQASTVSSSKLTCRYDIQIQNDRDFQVAKKIIGAKGCNMKNIIDFTLLAFNFERKGNNDLVKLRLRGKGSGFKEGPLKRESEEALHLCVSAKYIEVYNKACELVEDLLSKIYTEYKTFCKTSGQNSNSEMAIKKIECFSHKDGVDAHSLRGKDDMSFG